MSPPSGSFEDTTIFIFQHILEDPYKMMSVLLSYFSLVLALLTTK